MLADGRLQGIADEGRAGGVEGRDKAVYFLKQRLVNCHLDGAHNDLSMWVTMWIIIHIDVGIKAQLVGRVTEKELNGILVICHMLYLLRNESQQTQHTENTDVNVIIEADSGGLTSAHFG